MSRQKIIYFVAWGYEKLPEQVHGGDIDMFVHPVYYYEVREKLLQMGYKAHKCPKHGGLHKHEMFSHEESYSLHIFDSFCFSSAGKYFLLKLEPNDLVGRLRYKEGTEIRIPNPAIELLFTALRIFGGRKDCIVRLKRYVEELE